jgi:hypothetical protein
MLTKKNGSFFVRTVNRESLVFGIWDPHYYRQNGLKKKLQDYADVIRLVSGNCDLDSMLFEPIEYRHISRGDYLTFVVEPKHYRARTRWPCVGEQQLLFGTMRAYLGNMLVTPKAEWLGLNSPLFFAVKSEFLRIEPKDSYLYFWWAYFRSSAFLRNVPLGGGGTRPRLHKESLMVTPVSVPDAERRKSIHERLKGYAEREWRESVGKAEILRSVNSTKSMNARYLSSRTRQAQR